MSRDVDSLATALDLTPSLYVAALPSPDNTVVVNFDHINRVDVLERVATAVSAAGVAHADFTEHEGLEIVR